MTLCETHPHRPRHGWGVVTSRGQGSVHPVGQTGATVEEPRLPDALHTATAPPVSPVVVLRGVPVTLAASTVTPHSGSMGSGTSDSVGKEGGPSGATPKRLSWTVGRGSGTRASERVRRGEKAPSRPRPPLPPTDSYSQETVGKTVTLYPTLLSYDRLVLVVDDPGLISSSFTTLSVPKKTTRLRSVDYRRQLFIRHWNRPQSPIFTTLSYLGQKTLDPLSLTDDTSKTDALFSMPCFDIL